MTGLPPIASRMPSPAAQARGSTLARGAVRDASGRSATAAVTGPAA